MYRIDGTVNFFRPLRREAIRTGIRRLRGAINLVRRFSREAIRTGNRSWPSPSKPAHSLVQISSNILGAVLLYRRPAQFSNRRIFARGIVIHNHEGLRLVRRRFVSVAIARKNQRGVNVLLPVEIAAIFGFKFIRLMVKEVRTDGTTGSHQRPRRRQLIRTNLHRCDCS
nr:unnamed protein product [Haemonchus contortus]